MEFKRKKKRGLNQKVRRIWYSSPEGYRIIWRQEVHGATVLPRYQACVRTIVPGNFAGGRAEMWDFVNHAKRLRRSIKAAVKDCEDHMRLWSKALPCTGIRAARKALGQIPSGVPKWAAPKLDRLVFEELMR